MRHLNAWRDGEDLDPESGISHIAHIATSCNILLDAAACGTLQDDRNKRPGAGMSAERFEAFRKLIEATPAPVLRADIESRMPPTDDHDTHAAAHNSRMPEILAKYGEDIRDAVQEEWLNHSPWVDLAKHHPLEAAPCEVPAPVTPVANPKKFIDLDGELVELPPVPKGYDRWVYRGRKWDPGTQVMYQYMYPNEKWTDYETPSVPCGDDGHYIEAIKDDDCQKATVAPLPREALFGTIKPGDYVEGWLVHGENFSGRVANVVDIRGTKVFHFSDRASLTEDEIYSITLRA